MNLISEQMGYPRPRLEGSLGPLDCGEAEVLRRRLAIARSLEEA
jgi:hypothetical protein